MDGACHLSAKTCTTILVPYLYIQVTATGQGAGDLPVSVISNIILSRVIGYPHGSLSHTHQGGIS